MTNQTFDEDHELPLAVRSLKRLLSTEESPLEACRHHTTRKLVMLLYDLEAVHPVYSQDGGDEKLWRDLTQVALNAIMEKDEVVPALFEFLQAAQRECPHHH